MEKKNTNKHAKKKKSKQIKPIVILPLIFGIVVALVLIVVLSMSKSGGPVYGNRCDGVAPIEDSVISAVSDEVAAMEQVDSVAIEVNCKTVEVLLSLSGDVDPEVVDSICKTVVRSIDEKVGYDKTNSDSAYTDLFGTSQGVEQYDVSFVIKGESELLPAFATKHATRDAISYTFNTARDPELAEQLLNELQAEQEQADSEGES